MNYYVNLYRLPETQRREHCDNLTIGQLCRSPIEARNEAIHHALFAKPPLEYIGTINDPLCTKTIIEWLPLAADALVQLIENGHARPKDVKSFFEYWDSSVQAHQKRSAV